MKVMFFDKTKFLNRAHFYKNGDIFAIKTLLFEGDKNGFLERGH